METVYIVLIVAAAIQLQILEHKETIERIE